MQCDLVFVLTFIGTGEVPQYERSAHARYIYMCCVYPLSLQFLVRIDCLRSFVIGLHIYIYIYVVYR